MKEIRYDASHVLLEVNYNLAHGLDNSEEFFEGLSLSVINALLVLAIKTELGDYDQIIVNRIIANTAAIIDKFQLNNVATKLFSNLSEAFKLTCGSAVNDMFLFGEYPMNIVDKSAQSQLRQGYNSGKNIPEFNRVNTVPPDILFKLSISLEGEELLALSDLACNYFLSMMRDDLELCNSFMSCLRGCNQFLELSESKFLDLYDVILSGDYLLGEELVYAIVKFMFENDMLVMSLPREKHTQKINLKSRSDSYEQLLALVTEQNQKLVS